jgi:hypothetical protein
VLLRFPLSESLTHWRFSCPFVRSLPSVPVRAIPTPIFTNVLISNTSPCGKELLANRDGIVIAEFSCMGWICQHCGAPFFDSAYRVQSEESGVVPLDIIVCEHCHVEARDLGLHTEKIAFVGAAVRTKRVSRSRNILVLKHRR